MVIAIESALMTAEEFARMPKNGLPKELVRGQIVATPMPDLRHGYICSKIDRLLGTFVEEKDLGRVMCNDSFIKTERDPDSVRGSDICFFSFARLPRGPLSDGLYEEVPELVVEVRSPTDRWVKLVSKAAEYLDAGVQAVCVVDPKRQQVSVFRQDGDETVLKIDDEWALPDLLPGFSVRVNKLFE